MPHETEADRILRERMRQREAAQQEQERIAKEAAARQLEANRQHFLDELGRRVPAILALLRQAGYEGGGDVSIFEVQLVLGVFPRMAYHTRACWYICTLSYYYYRSGGYGTSGDEEVQYHLCLLSDGSFAKIEGVQSEPKDLHFGNGCALNATQVWKRCNGPYNGDKILRGLEDLHARLQQIARAKSQQS